MKVTGYKLQHSLRELHHIKDMAASRFNGSLYAFADQKKTSPQEIMNTLAKAETRIAQMQTAQSRYNLAITVNVNGDEMTLAEAVKRVGGAGRMEKMWRGVAVKKHDRYSYGNEDLVRTEGEVRAQPTITPVEAAGLAKQASRFASALREAIQVANATEIEIELDPAIFG